MQVNAVDGFARYKPKLHVFSLGTVCLSSYYNQNILNHCIDGIFLFKFNSILLNIETILS